MSLETIYLIHHTHTDIGFTNDQPIFWKMQYRFIDKALQLIDRYTDNPTESRFRWTVETTCGLEAWLKTASSQAIDRLLLEAAKRCDLFGNHLETLSVNEGAVEVSITPRRTITIDLVLGSDLLESKLSS